MKTTLLVFLIVLLFASAAQSSEQKINMAQLLAGFDEEKADEQVRPEEEFRRQTTNALRNMVKRGMVYPMKKPDKYDTRLFDLEPK